MRDRFDPYLQWLGIPPDVHPPDYYRLLQLDRYESDAKTIALAADGSMARVRAGRPGEHVAQWQMLLDELAAAKACLTDTARKSEYDDRLQRGSISTGLSSPADQPLDPSIATLAPEALFPPDHRAETASLPTHTAAAASAPLAVPVDGSAGAGGPQGVAPPMNDPMTPVAHVSDVRAHLGAAAAPAAPENLRSLLTPVTQQKRSPHAIGIAIVLVGSSLLAAVAALFFLNSKTDVDPAAARQPAGQDGDPPPKQKMVRTNPVPSPGKTVRSNKPAAPPRERPESSPGASKPSPQPTVPPAEAKSEPTPKRPTQNVPPPSTSKPSTSKPSTSKPSTSKPAPSKATPPAVSPEPSPTPPPKVEPRPTALQVAAFNNAVKKALAALQRRDAAVVNRHLHVARKNAVSQAQQDRLERVRRLQQYAGEFFKAVRAGYDALEGDEELVIGGERMVVVDRTPKEITLRRRGRNQSFPPDAMPDSLSLTLALRWFDETNPTSKVFVGTFQALRGKVDVARELWTQARGDGLSEIDFLLPVLKEIPPLGKGKGKRR